MSFFNSALMKDLEGGSLPQLPVNTSISIDTKAIINLVAGLFIAGFLIIVTWKAFK